MRARASKKKKAEQPTQLPWWEGGLDLILARDYAAQYVLAGFLGEMGTHKEEHCSDKTCETCHIHVAIGKNIGTESVSRTYSDKVDQKVLPEHTLAEEQSAEEGHTECNECNDINHAVHKNAHTTAYCGCRPNEKRNHFAISFQYYPIG